MLNLFYPAGASKRLVIGGGGGSFPTLETADAVATNNDTSTTSHTLNVASNVASGDLLIIGMAYQGPQGHLTLPSGWEQIARFDYETSGHALLVMGRISDGTETTAVVTSTASRRSCATALRFSSHGHASLDMPESSTNAGSASSNPDGPSLTPSGGSAKYCWLTFVGHEEEATNFTEPTNYTSIIGAYGTTNMSTEVAYRELEASSEDPGTWSPSATNTWGTATLAVAPA